MRCFLILFVYTYTYDREDIYEYMQEGRRFSDKKKYIIKI